MVCYEMNIPTFLQDPSTKSRHADDVLVKSGVIEKKGQQALLPWGTNESSSKGCIETRTIL
jgi:hypothetical protein